jgi:peptidyl-prolyl cis-trans isomerase C
MIRIEPFPPRPRGGALAALATVAAVAALAGCSSDGRVLARVGNRTVTTDEFESVARGNESQYTGSPDSAKSRLLEDIVQRTLMLCEAERRGYFRDTLVARYRQHILDDELETACFADLVPSRVQVSDAEVEQLYAWRDSAAHVQVLYCVARTAADAAAAEIRRGASFGPVADRYSLPGFLPPGGDLGFLSSGALVPPLDRYLREAPPGELLGPVEAPGEGWFVLRVLERKHQDQPPFERVQPLLREMLRQRKQRLIALRAAESLRDAYDLQLEPGGAQAIFAHFNDPELQRPGAESLLAKLTPEEAATVLARYDGRGGRAAYTMADAIEDLSAVGSDRPNTTMVPAIERWIETRTLRRIARIEARRRHLDETPALVRRVEQKVDNFVLDSWYNQVIAPGTDITQEDVNAAYERNKHDYARLDEVRLLEVTLADSAAAATLMMHAGHAPSLREAVAMAAPGARVTEATVSYPKAPEMWKPYQAAFTGMSPKECVGPIQMKDGWLVAQVVSKQQGVQTFDELPPSVVQDLRQQAAELKRDQKLREVTEALRRDFKPEEHRERLKAIPWPVGAAPVTG